MTPLEQRVQALERAVVRYGSLTAPGGGAVAAARLRVGQVSAAMIQQISQYQFNLNAVSVAANAVNVQTITISGLALNDWVLVNPPGLSNAPLCSWYVSAANTLAIEFANPFTTAQNSPAGTYTVIAIRV